MSAEAAQFSARRFFIGAASASVFLVIFLVIEQYRGVSVPGYAFVVAIVCAGLVALGDQKIRSYGAEIGGWLYVVIFFAVIYLATLHLRELSLREISAAFMDRLNDTYSLKVLVAQRFKDAYIVLASAAFTLMGLFFVTVRDRNLNAINASRLMSTAEAFLIVLVLSVPALIFVDEPWWRWVLIFVGNSTVLLVLVRDPEHWPIDYARDSPVEIYFWDEWLKHRRGNAMISAIGLVVMPIAPVLGESLFFIGLFYVLYRAIIVSIFLYLSTGVRGSDRPEALARLFRIRIPPARAEEIRKWKEPFERTPGFGGTDWVPFVPGQLPPGPK